MQSVRRSLFPMLCLIAPLFVALLGEPALRLLSCSYYVTCDDAEFFIQNDTNYIPLNGVVHLYAHNSQCPVSWSILSQPGGWKVTDLGSGKAKLEPTSSYGSAGDITLQALSGTSCSTTILISAGSSFPQNACDSCACPTKEGGPKAN